MESCSSCGVQCDEPNKCDYCDKSFCRSHGYACYDYTHHIWYDCVTGKPIQDLTKYAVEVEDAFVICHECRNALGYDI